MTGAGYVLPAVPARETPIRLRLDRHVLVVMPRCQPLADDVVRRIRRAFMVWNARGRR